MTAHDSTKVDIVDSRSDAAVVAPAYINAVATATPAYDMHGAFMTWARMRLGEGKSRAVLDRMAERSGIAHRWSVLPPSANGGSQTDTGGFYDAAAWPGTGQRMAVYAREAPVLAEAAARKLGPLDDVTHLVVASCTGFVAPGVDQLLARRLGLRGDVERCLVGFMGCYAAVAALRTAYHIARSQPGAKVLVVTVELSSLHLQETSDRKSLLAMMLFADGAAAAIVSSDPQGLEIAAPFSVALPESEGLITWTITDSGFAMELSGKVPERISSTLADAHIRERLGLGREIDSWAVHAGGRSVLDAVEQGLELPGTALAASRGVLRDFGNMSSSTLMFTLAEILANERPSSGVAMAFGPGLAVEGFRYRAAP